MTNILRERQFLADEGLHLITREDWGAVQSYTSTRDVFEPVEGFVLHISVTIDGGNTGLTEEDDMRDIERIGQERFGIGFPYNAAVFDTGRLYEGQPLTRRGAHTVDDKNIGYKSTGSGRSMNFWWRAIVLPQMVTDDVTDVQVDQCARWAAAQIRAGYAKRNAIWIGHRDVAWKSCPGDAGYLRLPEIRRLTEHYVVNGLEDDMPYTETEMINFAAKGFQKAIVKGGPSVQSFQERVEEGIEESLAIVNLVPGKAVDQMHARVRDGVMLALNDPKVQAKLREILGIPQP